MEGAGGGLVSLFSLCSIVDVTVLLFSAGAGSGIPATGPFVAEAKILRPLCFIQMLLREKGERATNNSQASKPIHSSVLQVCTTLLCVSSGAFTHPLRGPFWYCF